MEGYKLHGRMESVEWRPPILSFEMERHGATALGSTRAEMLGWKLDLQQRKAAAYSCGYRQLTPREARLDVAALAEEVAGAILAGRTDPRLHWIRRGERVRVQTGQIP